MVQLTLPLNDNSDNDSGNSTAPNCDPSMSIYDNRSCIKDFLFCSDDNPCPSKIPCVDRVCQCLPNTQSYITLTPPPVRMYTIGCNFDTKRDFVDGCRTYEYGVDKTCVLNYCSKDVPCYAGKCDMSRNVCTNITSDRRPLPISSNPVIVLGDDPFGTHKESVFNPTLIIILAAASVVALAIVGCIIRTLLRWTKSSVAWASGKDSSDQGEKARGGGGGQEAAELNVEELNDNTGSAHGIARKPSKFTGPHFLPTPPLAPGMQSSNDISPFATPLPSPHFSPYSQANHSQSSSIMNPFRRAEDSSSAMSIELEHRGMSTTDVSGASVGARPGMQTGPVPVVVTPPPAMGAGVGYGSGPGVSRSATVPHREYTSGPIPRTNPVYGGAVQAAGHVGSGSGLHKSTSMQQLGSRPAPPPPSLSAPIPSISISLPSATRPSSPPGGVLQTPSLSLDSLIESASTPSSPTSPVPSSPASLSPPIGPEGSPKPAHYATEPVLVLQNGAERVTAVTVQPRQSMLKHSASVPTFVSSPLRTTPPVTPWTAAEVSTGSPTTGSPVLRKLPPGFESSPVTVSR
ncbi:hypothetical protein B0O80DRAFT_496201 [Mortierella sp. GBAus27b]|nr:hypothetical protein BGX31_007579 [Mortierella sp. GBA43]KAI8357436.1 hypothetical protein B0O80DRAFT_496201 [Mortierella sp. GBAus27b]